MSSFTTSTNHKFVGTCETTHERVCGSGSGVLVGSWGRLPKLIQVFGLTCKSEGHKNLFDEGRKGERHWGEVICKASGSSSYSVNIEALHFLYLVS